MLRLVADELREVRPKKRVAPIPRACQRSKTTLVHLCGLNRASLNGVSSKDQEKSNISFEGRQIARWRQGGEGSDRGRLLDHEGQESSQNRADRPHWVPRFRVIVRHA